MSDFIADLEAELREAAHRRANGGAVRRRAWGRVARRAVPALAGLAAVVAAIAAIAVLRGPTPDDDVAIRPAERARTTVPLPAAVPATACPGEAERPRAIETPAALRDLLGVLRRPQTAPDGLPPAGAGNRSWLPLAAFAADGVRRPARDRFAEELYLVPGTGPSGRPHCRPVDASGPPGLCLVTGPAGGSPRVACFTAEPIVDGAALALTGESVVHGVVADGVEEVVLETGGRTVRADVVENAYEARLPGARAGDPVTVRLAGGRRCDAQIDPALLRAVPVLRRPADPGANVPPSVLAAVPNGLEGAARIAAGGDGIAYWVLPFESPDPAAACGTATRACIVAARDGRSTGPVLCATPRQIATGEPFLAAPLDGRVIVYGFTRLGVDRVTVDIGDEPAGGVDAVDGGVAAGLLPEGVRWREGERPRFVPEPAERRDGTVALLNGTTDKGLAGALQGELVERVRELLPAGGTVVGNATSQRVERSEVLHLPGREAEAYPIGAALGIARVREVSREELRDAAAPGSAVIAIVVGRDARMR